MKTRFIHLALLALAYAVPSRAQNFGAIDTILQDNLAQYNGGVVCIISQDNQVLYNKSFGNLDTTSVRMLASVSKTLSAVVLMSLVDDGLLNLDDTIGKYMPIFTANGKGHCTIRQCFSHTGGWPDSEDYIGDGSLTLAQSVDSIAVNIPLAYTPGTAFLYGGISMQIVGRIAEIAGGEPWKQLFQHRLTDKLGMNHTTFCLLGTNPRIAGGVCSSPSDLQKLALMLLNKGTWNDSVVISQSAWEELWKDQTFEAPVIASPYPVGAPLNNPYQADTVRYGIGTWQDIVNPNTQYHEQISGAGLFGSILWIDRCRKVTGLIFTFSDFTSTILPSFRVMDLVRSQTGAGCSNTSTGDPVHALTALKVYPNPAHEEVNIDLPAGTTDIQLTDITGHLLQTIPVNNVHTVSFQLQGLAAGFYMIRTNSANQLLIKY